jgi:hypothetical protein
MSDIGNEITNSLDRNGRGGMLAPFRIFDGTLAQPGLAFLNETGLGIWRDGTGLMRLANSGANIASVYVNRFVTELGLEMRGSNIYKVTGRNSWLVDTGGNALSFYPSASVNGEDWNAAFVVSAQPGTGVWDFSIRPTIAGAGIVANGYDIVGSKLLESPRITPANPPTLVNGIMDWSVVPTASICAPGAAISDLTNVESGEMKRIWVSGVGSITILFPSGTFTWATGSPQWGTVSTIISLVAVNGTNVVGMTVPVG